MTGFLHVKNKVKDPHFHLPSLVNKLYHNKPQLNINKTILKSKHIFLIEIFIEIDGKGTLTALKNTTHENIADSV